MKKTITSIILLAISVALLASCNNSSDTTSTVSPVLTTNEPAISSPSPSPSLGIEIPFEVSAYITNTEFGKEDWITYINSPEELAAYYAEYGTDNKLERMQDVFLNVKYDEEFFQDKCLLLYYHFEPNIRTIEYESIVLINSLLSINLSIISREVLPALAPTHIVIELDKQYSGMKARLHWETQEIE